MTYNLIIILLEFKFLSKCKLFTTMKELVVKGLYSATCNFDFPRSVGSTSSKEDLKGNTLIFLGWCSSFENFPVSQYIGNLYGEIFS